MFGRVIEPVCGSGKFLILGEAPGQMEDRLGAPFVGSSGNLLWGVLKSLGINRQMCDIANRFWQRPPGNDIDKAKKHPKWHEYGELTKEFIRKRQPKIILCLGAEALNLLFPDLKLSEIRGYLLQWEGIPVIATYHPAAVLRNDQFMFPFKLDCRKAVQVWKWGIPDNFFSPELIYELYPKNPDKFTEIVQEI